MRKVFISGLCMWSCPRGMESCKLIGMIGIFSNWIAVNFGANWIELFSLFHWCRPGKLSVHESAGRNNFHMTMDTIAFIVPWFTLNSTVAQVCAVRWDYWSWKNTSIHLSIQNRFKINNICSFYSRKLEHRSINSSNATQVMSVKLIKVWLLY